MIEITGIIKINGIEIGTLKSLDITEQEFNEVIKSTRGKLLFKDQNGNTGENFNLSYYEDLF